MTKTVVITQSNYLPWRGYFDLLASADEVILLDSVQYTRRDWRNRNTIKTASGTAWLTIPVEVKGRYFQAIDETRIAGPEWAEQHARAIDAAYRRASHYRDVAPWLLGLLRSLEGEPRLSVVNELLLRAICERLGIAVPIRRCSDVLDRAALQVMAPTDRLARLAHAVKATRYLTGPAARSYLDVDRFTAEGIEVAWMSYDGYPEYRQLWGAFEPRVSVVDLLLNVGAEAPNYLRRVPV